VAPPKRWKVGTRRNVIINPYRFAGGGDPVAYVTHTNSAVIETPSDPEEFSFNSGTSGTNRLLVLIVGYQGNLDIDAITYAGESLTNFATYETTSTFEPDVDVWWLADPATGSNTVSVDTTDNGNADAATYSFFVFSNAAQTSPIALIDGAEISSALISTRAGSTSANGSMLLSHISTHNPSAFDPYTEDGDFTDLSGSTGSAFSLLSNHSYLSVPTAGSVQHTATWASTADNFNHYLFEIKAV
jgi:hypothetical protein